MMIEGMDYTVRLAPWLTGDVPALVSEDEDGHYNIYINERLAPHAKLESYLHELEHCEKNDFHSERSIYEVEQAAQTVLEVPAAVEPPPELTELRHPSEEELDAALRAWAREWVRQKVAEIEAQARKKPKYPPRGWDDPDLPPAIW